MMPPMSVTLFWQKIIHYKAKLGDIDYVASPLLEITKYSQQQQHGLDSFEPSATSM